jgi:hypothetical protein
MSGAYFTASGVCTNKKARMVFVWCADKSCDARLLIGSGHTVNPDVCYVPPGIRNGQFRVTFILPDGCSEEDVIVTDDNSDGAALTGITVKPCSTRTVFRRDAPVIAGVFASPG